LTRGFDAVEQGHADVEHGNVGQQLQRLPHGFTTIADFAHDLPVALFFEDLPQALPYERVVVAEQKAEPSHGRALPLRVPRAARPGARPSAWCRGPARSR